MNEKTKTTGEAVGSPDRQFASTLARGLEILRCFTPEEPVLSNRQLAERTGLSKPTVSRLTYTLSELGYMQTDRRTRKLRLGPAVLALALPVLANIPLRQIARSNMRALADTIGGSVSLAARDRLNMIYIESSRSTPMLMRQLSDIGLSHPVIASSNGRAYLASCTEADREALLNGIRIKSPEHWECFGARALWCIDKFQELGFCYSYGEYQPEVCTVGVPYRYAPTGELYAFNCVIHSYLVKPGQLESDTGPRLAEMVRSFGNASIGA